MLKFLNNPIAKKVIKYGGIAFSGLMAIGSAVAEQKQLQRFEELEKAVSELKKTK